MNEKEAKEVIANFKGTEVAFTHGQDAAHVRYAYGYLSAIEKAKELVDALDHIYIVIDHHENHVYKEEMEALLEFIEDKLARWEAEK